MGKQTVPFPNIVIKRQPERGTRIRTEIDHPARQTLPCPVARETGGIVGECIRSDREAGSVSMPIAIDTSGAQPSRTEAGNPINDGRRRGEQCQGKCRRKGK